MIRYFVTFFSTCHLFTFKYCEALRGENVLPAEPHEFPFVVSLGRRSPNNQRTHFCTGSLITSRHVLTAAHCVEPENIRRVDVIIDRVDLTAGAPRYNVNSWVTYNEWALQNEIALEFGTNHVAVVTLSSIVICVKPVTLTNLNDQQLHRTMAVIAGYGRNNEGRRIHSLQKAKVTIMTPENCEHHLQLVSNLPIGIEKNFLCTSADPFAITACGDSGGPLLDENNVLVGIVRGTCPNVQWGEFPPEFYNKYMVNVHPSINYYKEFIESEANVNAIFQK